MSTAYGPDYFQHGCGLPYDRSQPHWFQFFGHIADEIVLQLKPRRVLDAGCAKGFLVEALRDRDVEAFGFDISDYAIGEVRPDVRRYCWVASITEPLPEHYDLITCIEVLEHVPEAEGRQAIANLAAHADAVLFSSTPSDFNEPTHVNVRPVLYWLKEFREAGFAPDFIFDASFVSPQAVLFRRSGMPVTDEVLQLFARKCDLVIALHEARQETGRQVELVGKAQKELESERHQHAFDLRMLQAELQHARAGDQGIPDAHEAELLLSEMSALEASEEARRKLEMNLHELAERLHTSELEIESLKKRQVEIESGLGWRLLGGARRMRDQLLPIGTRRRHMLDLGIVASKITATYGLSALVQKVRQRIRTRKQNSMRVYHHWIELHEPGPQQFAQMRAEAESFAYRPVISLITPVYNTNLDELRACIESVRGQVYGNWELCLCDDLSPKEEVRTLLREYEALDERIKVKYSDRNRGIALASNEALTLASGEFIGLLDHDDELAPHALFEAVCVLQDRRDADIIYSDEDKLSPEGERCEPFFKPDWSPELLRSCMYTCHFTVYRKSLLERIGGFRAGFDGSQDYDLMLRASELSERIYHVPKVLYRWRKTAASAAGSSFAKPYAFTAAKRALAEHLARRGVAGQVLDGKVPGTYRMKYDVAPERVSIIIPTRDQSRVLRNCVASIEEKTDYPDYEILIVDNNSSDPQARMYLDSLTHKVIPFPEPFNFSRINNCAARSATGRFLLFLNNDTEIVTPEWITAMMEFAQQPEIGVVGAKLLYPNGTIQHAGVTVGLGGVAGHPLVGFSAESPHYFGITGVVRNCSAVTAACMLVRRDVFERVGGFDENMPVGFNDVDFCMRVLRAGYRIVWTPFAVLYHHESASRGRSVDPKDVEFMRNRWGEALLNDPYYNPNLTLQMPDYSLRFWKADSLRTGLPSEKR